MGGGILGNDLQFAKLVQIVRDLQL
jgi:hypothetical protein